MAHFTSRLVLVPSAIGVCGLGIQHDTLATWSLVACVHSMAYTVSPLIMTATLSLVARMCSIVDSDIVPCGTYYDSDIVACDIIMTATVSIVLRLCSICDNGIVASGALFLNLSVSNCSLARETSSALGKAPAQASATMDSGSGVPSNDCFSDFLALCTAAETVFAASTAGVPATAASSTPLRSVAETVLAASTAEVPATAASSTPPPKEDVVPAAGAAEVPAEAASSALAPLESETMAKVVAEQQSRLDRANISHEDLHDLLLSGGASRTVQPPSELVPPTSKEHLMRPPPPPLARAKASTSLPIGRVPPPPPLAKASTSLPIGKVPPPPPKAKASTSVPIGKRPAPTTTSKGMPPPPPPRPGPYDREGARADDAAPPRRRPPRGGQNREYFGDKYGPNGWWWKTPAGQEMKAKGSFRRGGSSRGSDTGASSSA